MRPLIPVFLLSALAPLAAGPARAQRLPEPVRSSAVANPQRPAVDTVSYREDPAGAMLGAAVIGVMAFVTAWRAGLWGESLWVEAVGVGLGAHVGNGRRGNALMPLAVSVGIMAVARFAVEHWEVPDAFILAVPLTQILAATAAELGSARPRAAR